VRAQRRTPRAAARAQQHSRRLGSLFSGARAAPHASRRSAREAFQPPAGFALLSGARAAPHASRRSARPAAQSTAREYVLTVDRKSHFLGNLLKCRRFVLHG